MSKWQFSLGVHELSNGIYAYLQPDGSWGWNNAGLIVDGEASMLVDTLFDEKLTAVMLKELRNAVGRKGREIDYLVNTHANGDHTYGNRLVEGAEIIASKAAADEMDEVPPAMLAAMVRMAPNLGELGEYVKHCFGAFDFEGIVLPPVNRTFEGELEITVGDTRVELIEVGPAHTRGDVLVHVPNQGVVFTGDILFIEGTPIIWAGPVRNWIEACERIEAMDVDTIVPGHGPMTDKRGVRAVREYLAFIDSEARARFDAGLSACEAAKDIALGEYANWGDAERLAVNVHGLYREYDPSLPTPDVMALFNEMSVLWRRNRKR